MRKLTSILLSVSAFCLMGQMVHAAPLGTAFNYQGRLEQNGQPASNWVYSFRFALYDAASGGTFLGTNLLAVPVTNGLFSTTLDYGIQPFLFGDATWLEIGVTPDRVSPTPAYTALAPRTRLSPTPAANWANVAALARNVTNGAVTADGLRTVGVPSPGQVLGYDGSSLVWQPSGGPNSVWNLNGSSAYYNAGNVGIGTAQPSGRLTVTTTGDQSPSLVTAFDARHAVIGTPSAGVAISYSSLDGKGYITSLAPNVAWKDLVLQASTLSFRPSGGAATLSVLNNGNVGIGTTAPTSQLDVAGSVNVRNKLYWGFNSALVTDQGGSIELGNSLGSGNIPYIDFHYGVGADQDYNVRLVNDDDRILTLGGYLLRVNGLGGEQAYIGGDGSGDVEVGSLNPGVTAVSLWNPRRNGGEFLHLNMKSCTITGGADLAEPFPMKEEQIEKGSVVVIDEEHPGRLKMSTRAYDTQVAGIVSGANGINPGIALKQEGALDQGQNVALTGRVYVKADASHGAIKPGDLLTTSDTPGHAMKVTDHARAQGAILGKAMSALREGTGLVLVLVTLQ